MMAGGARIGSAFFEVIPKLNKAAAEQAGKEAGDTIGRSGTGAANAFGSAMLAGAKKMAAPIAAAFSAVAIKKFGSDCVSAFTDLAGSTKSLQRVIGGTAEEVSGMSGAMKLAGMDTDKASTCLTIFSKKLQAAQGDTESMAAMSQMLGAEIFDATGKIRPMNEILPQVADKFAGMEDGAEKTALACQLFGRSGTDMLPFLNKGSAGIEELTAKAKELGIVIDDQAISKFGQYKAALREWDTALQGAQVSIGESLIPFITMGASALTDVFVPAIQGASQFISDFFTGLASTIDTAGFEAAFTGISDAFMSAFPEDGGSAAGFGEAVGSAVNGLVPVLEAFQGPAQLAGNAIAFMGEHPEVVTIILGIAAGYAAIQAVQGVAGVMQAIGGALGITAATAPAAGAGLATTAAGETAAGSAAAGAAPPLLELGAAVLMVGAGVALACLGMAMLAQSAIALAGAGPGAAIGMIAMVGAIALLAAGAAFLGPALTAGSIGMLAFGAAVLMVGVGILVACAGITMLAMTLPLLAEYGASGAAGMMMVGSGALVMGALVLAGGAMVLAAGALIVAGGAIALAGGALFVATGALMLAGGAMMLAAGAMAIAFSGMLLAAVAGVAALNFAIGDLGDKVGTIGWGFQTVAATGGAATAALFALSGAAPQVAGGFNSLASASNSLGGAITQLPPKFQSAATSTIASMTMMSVAVVAAIAQMQSAIQSADLTIQVKMGPLPHFYMDGQFNAETGAVPTVGVNWYANGGVFTSASFIGIGEAGREAALPLNNRVYGEIAEGITDNGGGSIDYDKLAYAMARELDGMTVQMDGVSTVGALVAANRRLAEM